ncbi:16920_t:CDS:2, partial [Entrophospora sp. SA101]
MNPETIANILLVDLHSCIEHNLSQISNIIEHMNINLLFDAANELMTKPGIEGLEWVIDGWQKYLDLTVLSDDDSTIK